MKYSVHCFLLPLAVACSPTKAVVDGDGEVDEQSMADEGDGGAGTTVPEEDGDVEGADTDGDETEDDQTEDDETEDDESKLSRPDNKLPAYCLGRETTFEEQDALLETGKRIGGLLITFHETNVPMTINGHVRVHALQVVSITIV